MSDSQSTPFARFMGGKQFDEMDPHDYERMEEAGHVEALMVTESIDAIQSAKAVSKSMVAPVQELLPKHLSLHSYTEKPSNTNRIMTLEALSNGLKLALVVGAVAVMGTVIWYLMKIKGKTIPQPDVKRFKTAAAFANDLDNVVTAMQREGAAWGQAMRQDLEKELAKRRAENAGKEGVVEDTKGMSLDELVAELGAVISKTDAAYKELTVERMMTRIDGNQLMADILIGEYHYLIKDLGVPLSDAMSKLMANIRKEFISPLTTALARGTPTADDFARAEAQLTNAMEAKHDIMRRVEEIGSKWITANNLKPTNSQDDLYFRFTDQFDTKFQPGGKYQVQAALKESEIIDDEVVRAVVKSQDEVAAFMTDLHTLREKLEKTEITPELGSKIKGYMNQIKGAFVQLDDFFSIFTHEVASFNTASNLIGRSVTTVYKELDSDFKRVKSYVIEMTDPQCQATQNYAKKVESYLSEYEAIAQRAKNL